MAGTPFKDGPAFITDSSDDLYVPASSAVYALVRHIHLVNTHSAAVTVSLYVGATGAEAGGTQILADKSIAVGDVYDLYFPAGLKLTSTDFLVGDASVTNEVTATISGELYAT
jgi:hypothetical protein